MASVDEVLFARALTRCEAVTTQGDAWRADPRFHHVCRPPRAHLHVCVRGALLPDQHGRYAHAVQSAAFRGMALLRPRANSHTAAMFVASSRMHVIAALRSLESSHLQTVAALATQLRDLVKSGRTEASAAQTYRQQVDALQRGLSVPRTPAYVEPLDVPSGGPIATTPQRHARRAALLTRTTPASGTPAVRFDSDRCVHLIRRRVRIEVCTAELRGSTAARRVQSPCSRVADWRHRSGLKRRQRTRWLPWRRSCARARRP